jgi:uroporphyrinogen decarboxylase
MATSRERFLQTCRFQPADPPWVRWGAFVWPETGALWRTQGYEGPELGWNGEGLTERFGLDELLRVDPWYGPVPDFTYEVIEEDDRTKLYINHEGILMRELKEHSDTSMPQFVRFPVETPEDFERFAAERLTLNAAQRFPQVWQEQVAAGRLRGVAGAANITASGEADTGGAGPSAPNRGGRIPDESPRQCWADRWGGFFGSLRNMLGLQNLCLAFYDQPELVERMMEERADRIIEITDQVLKHTAIDVFWYWEDMAYKHGPLIDPQLYRRFSLKHYRRVNDWLHSRGIRYIGLDSDGDISTLIPLWIESGINMLWPFERQSGMDPLEVRRSFGRDLILMGGIDKRSLVPGGEAMRQEVDRIMPLVKEGGYIPELDHSVPPDVSWPNFCEYISYLKHRLERG